MTAAEPIRLDKFLAQASTYSRSDIKRAVRRGEVSVDGVAATDPGMKVALDAEVCLHGQRVEYPRKRYYMLYKPEGVVSVTKDGRHRTALDLLEVPRSEQLHIAGRLDLDATGLLLLTDDGDWTHRVTSPRKVCDKVYRVRVAEELNEELVEKFRHGIWLDYEKVRTRPAELEILSPHEARLTIHEGRYHQVKRMFAALGNHVEALHREQIGGIHLDPALQPGEYRPLTAAEVEAI